MMRRFIILSDITLLGNCISFLKLYAIVFLFPIKPFCQGNQYLYRYEIGDTLSVLAKSGLTLRDSASMNANKITVLPFRSSVVALSPPVRWEVNADRYGCWIRVSYHDMTGYAFAGFLSTLKIPPLTRKDLSIDHLSWFETIALANADSLTYKGHTLFPGFDQDGKDQSNMNWEIYKDGTFLNYDSGYEETNLIIESYEFTMNDVLNILEYYIDELNSKFSDYMTKNWNHKLDIQVTKEERYIKRIECGYMNFKAESSLTKNIIVLKIDG